tara:strand:+ start:86 stop:694 length:609 start_codon:yes stop_codon:yes gene_type:complete
MDKKINQYMGKNSLNFKVTKRGSSEYIYEQNVWYLDNQLDLNEVLKMPEFKSFTKAGEIVVGNNTAGYNIELKEDFKYKPFVIYLLTAKGKILKGGKSKNPLNNRSYKAGTEHNWTINGTPSVTNYVWSQLFRESLREGYLIEFYGYEVPSFNQSYTSFDGEEIKTLVSPYEAEEVKLNKLLKKLKGNNLIGEGDLLNPIKE